MHTTMPSAALCSWDVAALECTFDHKFRQLILVKGHTIDRQVDYQSATLFHQLKDDALMDGIRDDRIILEFGARIDCTGSLRNHGTRFRVRCDDLPQLYRVAESITDPVQKKLM